MKHNAQTFWLENLKLADQYNNWIFSQISPYLGNKVLEVGCGNGNFTVFLAEKCPEVVAVDLNREYVEKAKQRLKNKKGVQVLVTDATKTEWQDTFDTIIMLDVLEHIEDDVLMLQNLRRCLKTGGKIIIKVPALNWLYSPMDKVIGHYKRYEKKNLIKTFQKSYFSKPSIWYFNFLGIFGWWLNGKILKKTTPPSQQVGLFNKIVPILKRMETIIKPPIGLSLFAIGIKSEY